jgi:predicted RNA binding protein YcfA (HicA-like mRNA interferase family)
MSVEHIDIVRGQLPELFATKELPENWDEGLIIVPVPDVERITKPEPVGLPKAPEDLREADFLEHFGEYDDQGVSPGQGVTPVVPSPEIVEVLGGTHGGSPLPYTDRSKMPPPDCHAFYLPFHYFYPIWWGVYLLYEGVLWLRDEIIRRSGNEVGPSQAFEAARLFLYYHEAFHHKTECFAMRLELAHRQAFYKTGFEQHYRQTFGTIDCWEEGLANATALKETWKKLRNSKVDKALASYVAECPPGYDQGNKFRRVFDNIRCQFAEKNHHVCLPELPSKSPEVWKTAPHLFHGIANIKSHVNYVLPRNSPIAARLPFRPCLPPNKVVKKLRELVGLEKVREGGRHAIWKTADGRILEIPRHARDLGRGLLRKILRQAGLEMGLDEFLRA